MNRQFIGKVPDAGKDGGQEKRVTEDAMVRLYHQFNGHEFKQTLGDSENRESWGVAVHGGHKELNIT